MLQDRVRLKNLVDRAEEILVREGMRAPEARDLLRPVRDLPTDEAFWRQRGRGLAVFVAPGCFECYRVPRELDEYVAVNRRFHVKPLLSVLDTGQTFWVLALSKETNRLLRGNWNELVEVTVAGMPAGIEASLEYETPDRVAQRHTASRGRGKEAVVFHGQGGEPDSVKEETRHYLRLVAEALRPVLQGSDEPLVLAGVDYLLPLFRGVCDYKHIVEGRVTGNVEHWNATELHARAWPIVQPELDQIRHDAVARFQRLAGSAKVSAQISEIVPAAVHGKIETLFIDRRAQQWGAFHEETGRVELHRDAASGDDDLLDFAAVQTLLNRGTVFAMDSADLPASGPVAAVYRF